MKKGGKYLKTLFKTLFPQGPVAQWITRLTTDQKIPGSTPGRLETFFNIRYGQNFF